MLILWGDNNRSQHRRPPKGGQIFDLALVSDQNGDRLCPAWLDEMRVSRVERYSVDVTVSGEPGRPITFAAAPQERVLPDGVKRVWQPQNPERVGADLIQWPQP